MLLGGLPSPRAIKDAVSGGTDLRVSLAGTAETSAG